MGKWIQFRHMKCPICSFFSPSTSSKLENLASQIISAKKARKRSWQIEGTQNCLDEKVKDIKKADILTAIHFF